MELGFKPKKSGSRAKFSNTTILPPEKGSVMAPWLNEHRPPSPHPTDTSPRTSNWETVSRVYTLGSLLLLETVLLKLLYDSRDGG